MLQDHLTPIVFNMYVALPSYPINGDAKMNPSYASVKPHHSQARQKTPLMIKKHNIWNVI